MERLTEHHVNKSLGAYMVCSSACIDDNFDCNDCKKLAEMVDRLAAYEDTGLTPEEIDELLHKSYGPLHKKLGQWIAADQDGRLVVLPCKVGDTVFEANKRGYISTYKVISIHISDCSVLIGWELIDGVCSNLNGFEMSILGKTVFLTREKAEAELKKMEE